MGRPRKQTVDYFPHYVAGSRTKDILQGKWGNDGYAVWFKLLELLGRSDGHYYDCTKAVDREYLVSIMKTDEAKVFEIIETLVEMEKLDRELWESNKIIWCQQFVDNLQDVYSKRTISIPQKPVMERKSPNKAENNDVNAKEKQKSGLKPDKAQKTEPQKAKYAEFVSMTEGEYDKLVSGYGKEQTDKAIEILDNYKGANGKSYKSDYRAILTWAMSKAKEDIEKEGGERYGRANVNRGNNRQSPSGFKPSDGFKHSE